jgi:hypothetical protein
LGRGKLYHLFTLGSEQWRCSKKGEGGTMSFIALAAFAMILFLGRSYGAWEEASSNVQLTLVICFLLGAVCGYKTRG